MPIHIFHTKNGLELVLRVNIEGELPTEVEIVGIRKDFNSLPEQYREGTKNRLYCLEVKHGKTLVFYIKGGWGIVESCLGYYLNRVTPYIPSVQFDSNRD